MLLGATYTFDRTNSTWPEKLSHLKINDFVQPHLTFKFDSDKNLVRLVVTGIVAVDTASFCELLYDMLEHVLRFVFERQGLDSKRLFSKVSVSMETANKSVIFTPHATSSRAEKQSLMAVFLSLVNLPPLAIVPVEHTKIDVHFSPFGDETVNKRPCREPKINNNGLSPVRHQRNTVNNEINENPEPRNEQRFNEIATPTSNTNANKTVLNQVTTSSVENASSSNNNYTTVLENTNNNAKNHDTNVSMESILETPDLLAATNATVGKNGVEISNTLLTESPMKQTISEVIDEQFANSPKKENSLKLLSSQLNRNKKKLTESTTTGLLSHLKTNVDVQPLNKAGDEQPHEAILPVAIETGTIVSSSTRDSNDSSNFVELKMSDSKTISGYGSAAKKKNLHVIENHYDSHLIENIVASELQQHDYDGATNISSSQVIVLSKSELNDAFGLKHLNQPIDIDSKNLSSVYQPSRSSRSKTIDKIIKNNVMSRQSILRKKRKALQKRLKRKAGQRKIKKTESRKMARSRDALFVSSDDVSKKLSEKISDIQNYISTSERMSLPETATAIINIESDNGNSRGNDSRASEKLIQQDSVNDDRTLQETKENKRSVENGKDTMNEEESTLIENVTNNCNTVYTQPRSLKGGKRFLSELAPDHDLIYQPPQKKFTEKKKIGNPICTSNVDNAHSSVDSSLSQSNAKTTIEVKKTAVSRPVLPDALTKQNLEIKSSIDIATSLNKLPTLSNLYTTSFDITNNTRQAFCPMLSADSIENCEISNNFEIVANNEKTAFVNANNSKFVNNTGIAAPETTDSSAPIVNDSMSIDSIESSTASMRGHLIRLTINGDTIKNS